MEHSSGFRSKEMRTVSKKLTITSGKLCLQKILNVRIAEDLINPTWGSKWRHLVFRLRLQSGFSSFVNIIKDNTVQ